MLIVTLKGHNDFVNNACFSNDGKRIITASLDHTAKIWEASTGKLLMTLAGHAGNVTSACFSPDGSRIVTSSADRFRQNLGRTDRPVVSRFEGPSVNRQQCLVLRRRQVDCYCIG